MRVSGLKVGLSALAFIAISAGAAGCGAEVVPAPELVLGVSDWTGDLIEIRSRREATGERSREGLGLGVSIHSLGPTAVFPTLAVWSDAVVLLDASGEPLAGEVVAGSVAPDGILLGEAIPCGSSGPPGADQCPEVSFVPAGPPVGWHVLRIDVELLGAAVPGLSTAMVDYVSDPRQIDPRQVGRFRYRRVFFGSARQLVAVEVRADVEAASIRPRWSQGGEEPTGLRSVSVAYDGVMSLCDGTLCPGHELAARIAEFTIELADGTVTPLGASVFTVSVALGAGWEGLARTVVVAPDLGLPEASP